MNKADLIWKGCAALIVPAFMWITSISSQLAVSQQALQDMKARVASLESDAQSTSRLVVQNASRLEGIAETLERIHQTMSETRSDIRSINQRLLGRQP